MEEENRKLTVKQQRFVDFYIANHGNATEAAIQAGYSRKTAPFIGYENLNKPYIASAVKMRLDEIKSKRTMSLEEAVAILSSIARGEPQKYQHYGTTTITESGSTVTRDIDKEEYIAPSSQEKSKAAELLVKFHGGFTDRHSLTIDVPVIFEGEDVLED